MQLIINAAGEDTAIFVRRRASCGKPISREGALLAALAFFAARGSEGDQYVRAS